MVMNIAGQLLSVDGTLAQFADVEDVLIASGHAVLEAILLYSPTATGSDEIKFELKDADDNILHQWHADMTNVPTLEGGLWCGKYGIRSANGLKIDVTNDGATNTGYAAIYAFRAPV